MSRPPVLLHDVFEGSQEVLLEPEVGQLALLQELHGQLPQRVHGKDGDVLIGVAAHLDVDVNKHHNNQSSTYFSVIFVCLPTPERFWGSNPNFCNLKRMNG